MFEFLPENAMGSTGKTLGCPAQAENVKVKKDGTFAGSLIPQLDRRFNTSFQIPNPPASQTLADFVVATLQSTGKLASNQAASVLNPYYSTTTAPFADAQMTLSLHTSWSPPTKVDMRGRDGLVPPTLKAVEGVVICSCI